MMQPVRIACLLWVLHRARLPRLTRSELSDRHVLRVGDDTAVVSVLADLKGTYDGQPIGGRLRYTRVWHRRREAWRIVAGHLSAVG